MGLSSSVRGALVLVLVLVITVPSAVLTLNRVIQPDVGWSIRLVAFTPYGLVGYAVGLVVVLVLLVRVRLVRARAAARHPGLLALIVCLALGLSAHATWVAPGLVGHRPQVVGETFTVMNLNLLRGSADADRVVELVEDRDVEVLVLQEVTGPAVAALHDAGLSRRLPHRAGEPRSDVAGTMVFAKNRITGVRRLPTTFDSWAMTVLGPAGRMRLQAVHPAAPLDDAGAWRHDFEVLAGTLRDEEADLVVGDFNATLDHRPLQELGLRDAAEMTNQGWRPTWPDNGTVDILGVPVPRVVAIDHVLLDDSLAATDVGTASVRGTDHRAVIAEVGSRAD